MEATMFSKLEDFGIDAVGFTIAAFVVFIGALIVLQPPFAGPALELIWILTPIWLPIILLPVFWKLWVRYVRSQFIASRSHVLLELRLPREIAKSPKAMEAVLDGLHMKPGEGTFIDKYIKGQVRPWFSLEVASIGGEVRFFVWTRDFFRQQVENQVYAQYPDVEIVEVDDYTDTVTPDLQRYSIWGCDFELQQDSSLPIKTYVDYGLDKDPKEEFKIDPMSNLIETMASIQSGEQMWLQIMIQVSKSDWKTAAQSAVEEIRDACTPKNKTADGQEMSGFPNPSEEQKEKMQAITRKMSKPGFDVGMRGVYIAERDRFRPSCIAGLTHVVKQFNTNHLNGFKPTRFLTKFDFPWQDFREMRQNSERRQLFDAYKRRAYFYPPHETQPFVLNTEELATVFHMPSSIIQPPTLSRIPSKRAAPPTNLPTE